jgi:hypothetical protein
VVTDVVTNLRVLKRSRHKPGVGDVFAMQLPDNTYLFGRVIGAELELPRAPMPGSYLIYVYRHRSTTKVPDWAELQPQRLLLPPVFINRMPWTKGYFETIDSRDLLESDRLRQHCFRRWNGTYLDEAGEILPGPVEPCGDWGLSSYRWLDDEVSDAVGIPRVPDDA